MISARNGLMLAVTLLATSAWAQISSEHLAERIHIINDLRVARVDRNVATGPDGSTTNAAAMIMRMSERKQWYVKKGMRLEPKRGHTFTLVTIHADDAVTVSDKLNNVYTLQLITQEEKDEYRRVHDMPEREE